MWFDWGLIRNGTMQVIQVQYLCFLKNRIIIASGINQLQVLCYDLTYYLGTSEDWILKYNWNVMIDGKEHKIVFTPGLIKGKRLVDGVVTLVQNTNWFIRLFDDAFEVDGKILHLTAIGNKIDLAVDGVYLNSKKPYTPIKTVPNWINILSGILLLTGMGFGGLIGLFIGAVFGICMIVYSISPKTVNPKPLCIGLASVAIVLQVLFFFMSLNLS